MFLRISILASSCDVTSRDGLRLQIWKFEGLYFYTYELIERVGFNGELKSARGGSTLNMYRKHTNISEYIQIRQTHKWHTHPVVEHLPSALCTRLGVYMGVICGVTVCLIQCSKREIRKPFEMPDFITIVLNNDHKACSLSTVLHHAFLAGFFQFVEILLAQALSMALMTTSDGVAGSTGHFLANAKTTRSLTCFAVRRCCRLF